MEPHCHRVGHDKKKVQLEVVRARSIIGRVNACSGIEAAQLGSISHPVSSDVKSEYSQEK